MRIPRTKLIPLGIATMSGFLALAGCSTTTQPYATDKQALANGYVPLARYNVHMSNMELDYLHRLEINDIAGLRDVMESWLEGDVFVVWASIRDPRTTEEDRDHSYFFLRLMAIQNEKFPVAKWNSDPKIAAIFQAAIDNDPANAAWLRRQNWNKPRWVERVD